MPVVLPTRCNILEIHEIYVNFSGHSGCAADTRNSNCGIALWQTLSSDYPADMRNSDVDKDLWLRRFFDGQTWSVRICQRTHGRPWSHKNHVRLLAIMAKVTIASAKHWKPLATSHPQRPKANGVSRNAVVADAAHRPLDRHGPFALVVQVTVDARGHPGSFETLDARSRP
jgi:hypothetical protein